MLLSGKLCAHIQQINTQAEQMLETITNQLKSTENITEVLKASDQLEWVEG